MWVQKYGKTSGMWKKKLFGILVHVLVKRVDI